MEIYNASGRQITVWVHDWNDILKNTFPRYLKALDGGTM